MDAGPWFGALHAARLHDCSRAARVRSCSPAPALLFSPLKYSDIQKTPCFPARLPRRPLAALHARSAIPAPRARYLRHVT